MPLPEGPSASQTNGEAKVERIRKAMLAQLQEIETLTLRVLIVLLVAIFIYAIATSVMEPPEPRGNWLQVVMRVFAVLVCLLLASAAGGGILGFLFGIPRQLQQANTQIRQTAAAAAPGGNAASSNGANGASEHSGEARAVAATSRLYGNNTNLEEISDWITKIIVGISLVQATTILNKVGEASQNFKTSAMQ